MERLTPGQENPAPKSFEVLQMNNREQYAAKLLDLLNLGVKISTGKELRKVLVEMGPTPQENKYELTAVDLNKSKLFRLKHEANNLARSMGMDPVYSLSYRDR